MTGIFNKLFTRVNEPKTSVDLVEIGRNPIPGHIAIIMDGNGRWAQKRGLPRTAGHRAGMEALKKIVEACMEIGVQYLTVYAFSTENWKRPRDEVDALMGLLIEYIDKELTRLNKNGIRVRAIGGLEDLPKDAVKSIKKAEKETGANEKLNLQIALNYGGRKEMVDAVKSIADQVLAGSIPVDSINEEVISRHLYTKGIPDPDLMIRPSGELRLSNFLIWQSAYTEFVVTNVLWPDFTREELIKAIYHYQSRQRRFGGL